MGPWSMTEPTRGADPWPAMAPLLGPQALHEPSGTVNLALASQRRREGAFACRAVAGDALACSQCIRALSLLQRLVILSSKPKSILVASVRLLWVLDALLAADSKIMPSGLDMIAEGLSAFPIEHTRSTTATQQARGKAPRTFGHLW